MSNLVFGFSAFQAVLCGAERQLPVTTHCCSNIASILCVQNVLVESKLKKV